MHLVFEESKSTRMPADMEGGRKVGLISGNLWGIIHRPSGTRTAIKVDECTPPRGEKNGGEAGGKETSETRRRKQDARAPETRVHIAVACRSYLIQSWIMLRQDAARIYDLGKKRVLTPDTQPGTRATASVSVDGEGRDGR